MRAVAAVRSAGPMMQIGPSLPLAASIPVTLLMGGLLAMRLRQVKDANLKFLALAIWLRFALSAFHQFTFARIAGITPNAVGSIVLFSAGLLLLKRRDLRLRPLLAVYGVILAIVVSAVANRVVGSCIDEIVKWGYYLVITLLTYRALRVSGEIETGKLLIWAFSLPIVLQVLSVILHVPKASEADGSVSWIGGYNHEAAFSVVLAAALFMLCLLRGLSVGVRLVSVTYLLAALYLANYRTSILATGPLLVVAIPTLILTVTQGRQRAFAAMAVVLATILTASAIAILSADRFADLVYLAQHPNEIIRPPNAITSVQRHILSGRLVIWSNYVYGFQQGSALQHLVGFGPDSWALVFPVYAHNTIISYLYEYGVVGVIAIVVLWLTMLAISFKAPSSERGPLVAAHVSFLVLNMATMPHWLIEGNILYGLICGITLYRTEALRPLAARRLAGRRGRGGYRAQQEPVCA